MSWAPYLLPLLTPARRAKEQGAIFYSLPEDIDPAQIDPLLREIVLNINLSGFCWTAECCQGHPDAAKPGDTGWDHNVEPYLRLVCHQGREGEVLAELMRACDPQGDDELEAIDAGHECQNGGTGTRTRDDAGADPCFDGPGRSGTTRFKRPPLSQLSYAPQGLRRKLQRRTATAYTGGGDFPKIVAPRWLGIERVLAR